MDGRDSPGDIVGLIDLARELEAFVFEGHCTDGIGVRKGFGFSAHCSLGVD